jgi:MFS family permease
MNWFVSILIAILTGAAGCLAAGAVATKCVDWYRISSREGQSGYFVIFIGIGGIIAGLILGLVVARLVNAPGFPGFFRALFGALLLTGALAGGAAMLCRGLADVPPRLDGRELDLAVEIRFPPGSNKPEPGEKDGFDLASINMRAKRRRGTEAGELEWSKLREESGSWILPARARVFTQRGARVIGIRAGGKDESFFVPLRSTPRRRDLEWSIWLPRPRPDGKPAVHTLTYRYRVEPRSGE